jgi:hypothetical protein
MLSPNDSPAPAVTLDRTAAAADTRPTPAPSAGVAPPLPRVPGIVFDAAGRLVGTKPDGQPTWRESTMAVYHGLVAAYPGRRAFTADEFFEFAIARWGTYCWSHQQHQQWDKSLKRVLKPGGLELRAAAGRTAFVHFAQTDSFCLRVDPAGGGGARRLTGKRSRATSEDGGGASAEAEEEAEGEAEAAAGESAEAGAKLYAKLERPAAGMSRDPGFGEGERVAQVDHLPPSKRLLKSAAGAVPLRAFSGRKRRPSTRHLPSHQLRPPSKRKSLSSGGASAANLSPLPKSAASPPAPAAAPAAVPLAGAVTSRPDASFLVAATSPFVTGCPGKADESVPDEKSAQRPPRRRAVEPETLHRGKLRAVSFSYDALPLYAASLGEELLKAYSDALERFVGSAEHAEYQAEMRADSSSSNVVLDIAVCSFVHSCYDQRPEEAGLNACSVLYDAVLHRNRFLAGKMPMTVSSLRSWRKVLDARPVG